MIIRPAILADISALHSLIESAYRGESAKAGWTHEADLLTDERTDPHELAAIISDPAQMILVAQDDANGLIGCVQISNKGTTEQENIAYLGLLTVDPARQAGGLGKILLAAGESQAAARFGATVMEMTVIASRAELIAYYVRRGYAPTGETRPFPHHLAGQATPEPLYFVVLNTSLKQKAQAS